MKKGNKSNSIATKFSVLKAVYNKALAEGIFTTPHSPFLQFKIGRLWTATRKRAIRKEEVQRLMQAEILADGSAYLDFARDIFLFSYLSAGINFKDIATLRYCDMDEEDIIALIGIDELGEEDKTTVNRARKIEQFLGQNFYVAEKVTGRPGSYVPADETIEAFTRICDGVYDDVPEQAFSGIGGIDDLEKKWHDMQKEYGA